MNMDVSNKEIEKLLKEYLKRLDGMDKDRDQMINKLKALSSAVKDINVDLDELFKVMDGDKITISIDDHAEMMEGKDMHSISSFIEGSKDDFSEDDYLSIIHSVLGET